MPFEHGDNAGGRSEPTFYLCISLNPAVSWLTIPLTGPNVTNRQIVTLIY